MKNLNTEEWFPIVDEQGNTIGKALRTVCHDGKSKLLHPVVHLHLFNSSGELFLQKRAMTKDILPGKWDTSVGGHLCPGETVEEALAREVKEELCIKNINAGFLARYIWESPLERELVNTFSTTTDETPLINRDEIEEGKFWSIQGIKDKIGKDIFTPNFEHEFKMLISYTINLTEKRIFVLEKNVNQSYQNEARQNLFITFNTDNTHNHFLDYLLHSCCQYCEFPGDLFR